MFVGQRRHNQPIRWAPSIDRNPAVFSTALHSSFTEYCFSSAAGIELAVVYTGATCSVSLAAMALFCKTGSAGE